MNLSKMLRLWANLEQEYEEETTLSERIRQARTYVDARLFRADVVAQLPPEAPAGYLMVTNGDTNIYVGTGAGRPLRKIPTQAV